MSQLITIEKEPNFKTICDSCDQINTAGLVTVSVGRTEISPFHICDQCRVELMKVLARGVK